MEAGGLAEAAWENLIYNHEIVVPILVEVIQERLKDNTTTEARLVWRDSKEIEEKLGWKFRERSG